MHELFELVLAKRDLSKAGELFNVENEQIVADLSTVVMQLEAISSTDEYLRNDNDQSVVEICITRVTSAVRETNTIEEHAAALVSLLDSCSERRLVVTEANDEEPSHAKIAADIMSFIFLNYGKRSVMKLSLPVAVKFLLCGNKEICRNLTSYLALAAIDNADTLSQDVCMDCIIRGIEIGNLGLLRVLIKVHGAQPSSVERRCDTLVTVLEGDLATHDLTNVLHVLSAIAVSNAKVLVPFVDRLLDCARCSPSKLQTLDVLVSVATDESQALVCRVEALVRLAATGAEALTAVDRIFAAVKFDKVTLMTFYETLIGILSPPDCTEELVGPVLSLMMAVRRSCPGWVTFDDLRHRCNEHQLSAVTIDKIAEIFFVTPLNANASQATEAPLSGHGEGDQVTVVGEVCAPLSDCRTNMKSAEESVATPAIVDGASIIDDGGACRSSAPGAPARERDAVQHFCEKHLDKIKSYISKVSVSVPIPAKCLITGSKSKKKRLTLSFGCTGCSAHCLYQGNYFFVMTKLPSTWSHLMFLNEQSKSPCALDQEDPAISSIKSCWSQLKLVSAHGTFTRLVTASFPSNKDREALIKELYSIRFFDLFEYNQTQKQWVCFVCNNPDKLGDLLQNGHPAIEGQLQEKKGKWRFFKRWKTRYFTLSGTHITYSKKDSCKATLPVAKIESVKAVRRGAREIPRAFEIFANNQKYVFKTKDGKNAEQWVHCLQLAVAQSQTATVEASTSTEPG